MELASRQETPARRELILRRAPECPITIVVTEGTQGPADHHRRPGTGRATGVLSSASASRSRSKWLVAKVAVISALLFVSGAAMIFTARDEKRASSPPQATATVTPLQEWWLQANPAFTELRHASLDVLSSVGVASPPTVEAACLHLHDAADVKMAAQLPSPDAELTAQLRAAVDDFHAAAHMCLASLAGAKINYHAEFIAHMVLADRQMSAAQDRINNTLMRSA